MTMSMRLANGQMVQIAIRTSPRARRLRLVSGIAGVEAVVPIDFSAQALSDFVASKRDWLLKTSKYYDRLRERCGGHEPGTIYYLGSRYRIKIVKDRQIATTVSDALKVITFHVADMRKSKHHQQAWYRQQTARIIGERLPALASRLGLRYNKVSIKNQKSRWASCSRKANLNFNLLLAAAPVEVIDYVIIHELMHLIELDHSSQFWELVRNVDPDYEHHREWLSSYSPIIGIEWYSQNQEHQDPIPCRKLTPLRARNALL